MCRKFNTMILSESLAINKVSSFSPRPYSERSRGILCCAADSGHYLDVNHRTADDTTDTLTCNEVVPVYTGHLTRSPFREI